MDRRSVLLMGLAGAAGASGALAAPQRALAAGEIDPLISPLAGGLYYTKQKPGRWAAKAGGHVPRVARLGSKVRVTTPHPMSGFKHYIVKHVILDGEFRYVSETLFDPATDKPVSEYDAGKLSGVVYAVSMCNLHDVWLSAFRV